MAFIVRKGESVYKNIIASCTFLVLLSGCAYHKKIQPQKSDYYQEIIAKFADLPDAPFQAHVEKVVQSDQNPEQIQIFYTCNMPKVDVIAFYEQQMERLGWELYAQSDAVDSVLHYSKPTVLCTILISGNKFSLYVSTKKGA